MTFSLIMFHFDLCDFAHVNILFQQSGVEKRLPGTRQKRDDMNWSSRTCRSMHSFNSPPGSHQTPQHRCLTAGRSQRSEFTFQSSRGFFRVVLRFLPHRHRCVRLKTFILNLPLPYRNHRRGAHQDSSLQHDPHPLYLKSSLISNKTT